MDSETPPPGPPRAWLLEVAYDGTDFAGWQSQPGGRTVQQALEGALSTLYAGAPIRVRSSGRTDAGVHALGMAAAFDPPVRPDIPGWKVAKALGGRLLPPSIRVRSLRGAPLGFDPRREAVGKAYAYVIDRSPAANPFTGRFAWRLPGCRDVDAIRRAMALAHGVHDFSSFAVDIRRSGKDPVRSLSRIEAVEFGDALCLLFIGRSFLYKMVRGLVGALAMVGEGRLTPAGFGAILEAHDRLAAPDTAPARGLFLLSVFFEPSEMEAFRLDDLPYRL